MKGRINKFKEELLSLLEKYGYSIAHEDSQGTFILCSFNCDDNDRLFDFYISYELKGDD